MSEQFEVGEAAIIVNQVDSYAYLNGVECIVTGEFRLRERADGTTGGRVFRNSYLIEADGQEFNALPIDLRKKRPPQQYSGELRIRELFDAAPVKQPAEIA